MLRDHLIPRKRATGTGLDAGLDDGLDAGLGARSDARPDAERATRLELKEARILHDWSPNRSIGAPVAIRDLFMMV